jgi:hypothetical protein
MSRLVHVQLCEWTEAACGFISAKVVADQFGSSRRRSRSPQAICEMWRSSPCGEDLSTARNSADQSRGLRLLPSPTTSETRRATIAGRGRRRRTARPDRACSAAMSPVHMQQRPLPGYGASRPVRAWRRSSPAGPAYYRLLPSRSSNVVAERSVDCRSRLANRSWLVSSDPRSRSRSGPPRATPAVRDRALVTPSGPDTGAQRHCAVKAAMMPASGPLSTFLCTRSTCCSGVRLANASK